MYSRPPLNEKLLNPQGNISVSWTRHLDSQYAYISSNLSQNGYVVPSLSTVQRDALVNVGEGTLIKNTDLNKAQMYLNGAWETITSA